jgi:hypothetical protein
MTQGNSNRSERNSTHLTFIPIGARDVGFARRVQQKKRGALVGLRAFGKFPTLTIGLHRKVQLVAAAVHKQERFSAGLVQRARQIFRVSHRMVVDFLNHVSFLQPG